MATNPMQRKARLSFILGMLVALVICGAIIAFLFLQLTNYQKKENENKAATVRVYALNQDVGSGQVITPDMYSPIEINKNMVPSNATSDLSVITNYALQDKEGNEVFTKDSELYIRISNRDYKLEQEEETENYYIERNNEKSYIELNSVPLLAKIEMKKNTIITKNLLEKGDNKIADDVRREEYNSFVLPMDLETGDYVDIRLMLPTGENYIVVAKKEVEVPNISGSDSLDTIVLNVSEDEILIIGSAIIDAYKVAGSKLYVDKYTEAGMQKAATPTYVVNDDTKALINKDPNILAKASDALKERYRNINNEEVRGQINKTVNAVDTPDENVQQGMQESIQKTQSTRQKYLDSLSGTID